MMYWVYLILFILIVFTPELIRHGFSFLSEEDVESLLIFCFGILGLLLYLGKESALLRTVKEKIFLQRETNQIRKDLSQTYSYIGEMNRRFDIVRNSLVALPKSALKVFSNKKHELYQPIFEALNLLTKTKAARLVFVRVGDGFILEEYSEGEKLPGAPLTGKYLLGTKKFFWEEEKCCIVRSPDGPLDVTAFILFEKTTNRLENNEAFQILSAEALFLYCVDRNAEEESARKESS